MHWAGGWSVVTVYGQFLPCLWRCRLADAVQLGFCWGLPACLLALLPASPLTAAALPACPPGLPCPTDTIRTVESYADVVVLRHFQVGTRSCRCVCMHAALRQFRTA